MKPVLKTQAQVTGYSRVLPRGIQNETMGKIVIKKARLVEIVKAFGNVDDLTDSELRVLVNKLRHEGSNYDSLINTDWYQNALDLHGEYMYFYLKSEISQRISLALDGLAARYGVRIDALEAANKALNEEIQSLKKETAKQAGEIKSLESSCDKFARMAEDLFSKVQLLTEENKEIKEENKEIKEENKELRDRVSALRDRVSALEYKLGGASERFLRSCNSLEEAIEGKAEAGIYISNVLEPTVDELETLTSTEAEKIITSLDVSIEILFGFLKDVSKFVDTTGVELHLIAIQEAIQKYRCLVLAV